MTTQTILVEFDYNKEEGCYISQDAKITGTFPLGVTQEQSLRRANHDICKDRKIKVGRFSLVRETPSRKTFTATCRPLTC